jgi:hypothetical protein
MVEFHKVINNPSTDVAIRRNATLGLAHALRSSLLNSWRLPFNAGEFAGVSLAGSTAASATPADPAARPRDPH